MADTQELDHLKNQKKALEKQLKDLEKREEELERLSKDEKRLQLWRKLSDMRSKFYADVEKACEGNVGFSLRKVIKMPDYYEYQNPTKLTLRSMDNQADWVKAWVASGKSEAELIAQAKKSRILALRATFNRKKRRKSKANKDATPKKAKKAAAVNATASGDAKAAIAATRRVS